MKSIALLLLFISFHCVYAQDSKSLDKSFSRALKEFNPDQVELPGLLDPDANTRSMGSKALKNAVREMSKTNFWSTSGLSPVQLKNIQESPTPFTALLKIKGSRSRDQIEDLLTRQLSDTGTIDRIKELSENGTMDLPGTGGLNGFRRTLTDNLINQLDQLSSGLF